MAEQNTERTEEPSDSNSSEDNGNNNLIECWKRPKKSNSTTLPKYWPKYWAANSQKSGKRMQEDHVGQVSSKKAWTYAKRQKEDEPTCLKYGNRFASDSDSSDKENICHQGLCWEDPTDDIVSLPDQEVLDQKLRGTSLWK